MKPRAALHQSAPMARTEAMSKAETTRPATPTLILSRRPAPTRVLCTNKRPSRMGAPMWSANSVGAAPVPPSDPSTTMKSGRTPVSSMALTMPMNSHGWPMHSLKPTGLPPDRVRNCWMKAIISRGVEKALWREGEMQSTPMGTPRVSAISRVTLAAGSTPPWPGLAPWLSLISTILTWSVRAWAANLSGSKRPSGVRQPK